MNDNINYSLVLLLLLLLKGGGAREDWPGSILTGTLCRPYYLGPLELSLPKTRWRDYVEDLSWSRLGIPAEHLSFVAEDRDAWRIQLELLPPRPPKDKRVQKID